MKGLLAFVPPLHLYGFFDSVKTFVFDTITVHDKIPLSCARLDLLGTLETYEERAVEVCSVGSII